MTRIDTAINADTARITSLAEWMTGDLAKALESASDTTASTTATQSGWEGSGATSYRTAMATFTEDPDQTASTSATAAEGVTTFATAITTAQQQVQTIRSDAESAGLDVTDTAILAPDPPGTLPTRPGSTASQSEVDAYQREVNRYNVASTRQAAYEQAQTDMAEVRSGIASAVEALDDARRVADRYKVDILEFAIASWVAAKVTPAAAAAAGEASRLLQYANDIEMRARVNPNAVNPYAEVDWARAQASAARAKANTLMTHSKDVLRFTKIAGGTLSVATFGVGVYLDLEEGESAAQAVTSNAGGAVAGTVAGAIAGAAIGTAIPIPVVGTVAGLLVGSAVGALASDAIDFGFDGGGGQIVAPPAFDIDAPTMPSA